MADDVQPVYINPGYFYPMLDAGCWMLVAGCWDVGYWMEGRGHCLKYLPF
jgi:hypothetical protein